MGLQVGPGGVLRFVFFVFRVLRFQLEKCERSGMAFGNGNPRAGILNDGMIIVRCMT